EPVGQAVSLPEINPAGLPRAAGQRFVPPISNSEPAIPQLPGQPQTIVQPQPVQLPQPVTQPHNLAPPAPIGGVLPERPTPVPLQPVVPPQATAGNGGQLPAKGTHPHSTQNSLQIAEV